MIEPVGRVLENRQLAIDNWAEVIWYSDAIVARVSPGWTVIATHPVGGGQVVGGGTVALEMRRVWVGRRIGWAVGELKTGASADVSVGVGGISGT